MTAPGIGGAGAEGGSGAPGGKAGMRGIGAGAAEGSERATGSRIRLAVLGDPLRYTRSPELHRAGCAALGLECESLALRTPTGALAATLERLAREGYTGCNLTMPLKEPALALVQQATPAAKRAASVNTVTFTAQGAHGDTTDGPGFLDLLHERRRDVAASRVVLIGAGGAARSLCVALADAGAPPARVVSRREPGPGEAWGGALAGRWSPWGSTEAARAVAGADVLVNCTPLSAADAPVRLDGVSRHALVVDLTYGETPTPWVAAARARGLEAVDGLALLVHQARRSLTRWLGRDVPLPSLLAAVGSSG